MKKHRQDAWSQDEDTLLAETVISHIRKGSTQLKAFEEVGKQLSRTASACGFRWNSTVRRLYEIDISKAKQERKQQVKPSTDSCKEPETAMIMEKKQSFPHFDEVLSYLHSIHEDARKIEPLVEEIKEHQRKNGELENQLLEALKEKEKIHNQLSKIQTEYESLLAIMERARKMVLLQEDNKIPRK